MSKMKKKTNKTMRLSVLAASLMMLAPLTHSANTSFSDKPLVGVGEEFAPHIVLALSVEFPTAGAAYFAKTSMDVENTIDPNTEVTTSYLGYFDNKKCYKYNHDGQYFYPSSMAKNKLCNNGSETEEFSGNMLNYMTMSAIDVFRSAMTGGNRAIGTGDAAENYTKADTTTDTYLRRANVVVTQNGLVPQKLRERALKPFWDLNHNTNRKETMRRLLPHGYVEFAMQDAAKSKNREGDPRSLGYEMVQKVLHHAAIRNPDEPINPGDLAGQHDKFVNHDLFFVNDGFTVTLARKVERRKNINGTVQPVIGHYTQDSQGNPVANPFQYFAVYKPRTHQSATSSDWVIPTESQWNEKWAKPLNVVVKVCDSGTSLDREANCKQYGNHYKPEGLLQQYTKKGMRVATMGYLNIKGDDVQGGVLRSRMKQLINDPDKTANQFQDEWDTTTGILNLNPDQVDANKTGALGEVDTITNSGTINYLNKFGDRSGYKTNDPGAELYYTALAYLRGLKGATSSDTALGNTTAVPYEPGSTGQIAKSDLTSEAKDGFPTIYDWDDPFTRGVKQSEYQCHQNSIIYIGDTNTHSERELPGFYNTAGSPAADGIQTKSYLERVLAKESNPFLITDNIGAGSTSPAGIVGLAYWARVNDIRPDISGVQNGNNFMIDVLESGYYKNGRNSYYLAAKYGGFSRLTEDSSQLTNTNDGATTNADNKPFPNQRWMWTDDPQGNTSIQEFAGGVPRNFAVANNPDAMVAALEKAMLVGTANVNPTQAATGLAVNSGEEIDFTENPVQTMLQSTYNFAQLTGDMIAYDVKYEPNAQNGTIFTRTERWRASTALDSTYHNNVSYNLRNLYTIRNNNVYRFSEANANNIFAGAPLGKGTAADLVKYVLGDNSKEGTTYRARKSLMGTVVNSTIMPITKVSDNAPSKCSYQDLSAVQSRPTYYAAAANDGILHLIDSAGKPVAGYMAGIAVDKISDFASLNYTHKYLNDGTPVIGEVCMGASNTNRVAKSVLLGTTGRGGGAVYALDVTDMKKFSENNVLWEFSSRDNADLGLTVSKPVITTALDGRPLAIVSSGYNNQSGKGSIFILDMTKSSTASWTLGTNYWKIELGTSGVGAPFVYDQDNDGVGDKIFVGDLEGKVWQIDRTANTGTGSWAVPYANNAPLFTPSSTNARPITGAPYADTVGGKLMVTVGTGKYFAESDLSAAQQNYAYGFIVGSQPIDENTLLQQQIITTPVTGDKVNVDSKKISFYSVTENPMTETHQGWRLTLLSGQNIAADALIRQKQAAEFTAARITEGVNLQCQRSGTTSYISVDAKTGGLNRRPMFDTNGDGKVDSSDERVAMRENHGMITTQTTLGRFRTTNGVQTFALQSDGGLSADMPLGNFDAMKGVRRISWREIF